MGHRIAIISNVMPLVEPLAERLREIGHEPVAWLLARRAGEGRPPPPWGEASDSTGPQGLSILFAQDKDAVAPLLSGLDLDVTLCWASPGGCRRRRSTSRGSARSTSIRAACRGTVAVPDGLGAPRRRRRLRVTWHRMDADYDTGPILAETTVPIEDQDTSIEQIGVKMLPAALGLLPRVFERLEAGDPGDSQSEDGAGWAGAFDEDYASIDWAQPAVTIHDQVRAWYLTFGSAKVPGPIAELDGERMKLLRTSLTDPGAGARAVECGDGRLWIVESEPSRLDPEAADHVPRVRVAHVV